jgi:hypothetical protein
VSAGWPSGSTRPGGSAHEHSPRRPRLSKYASKMVIDVACGAYMDPRKARVTIAEWCITWLDGYGTHRPSTIRQAQVHIRRIVIEFRPYSLGSLRPPQIRSWMARLRKEGLEDSYIYALHGRLAVHTVYALHGRLAQMRAVVHPRVQYPPEELKTKISRTPIPIPASLVAELSAQMAAYGRHGTVLTGGDGCQLSPWAVEQAVRTARKKVQDLPAGFRYHDLGTTSRVSSSPRVRMSRPSRRVSVMPARRPRSTPAVISSPTRTSPPAPLSMPSSRPGQNSGEATS